MTKVVSSCMHSQLVQCLLLFLSTSCYQQSVQWFHLKGQASSRRVHVKFSSPSPYKQASKANTVTRNWRSTRFQIHRRCPTRTINKLFQKCCATQVMPTSSGDFHVHVLIYCSLGKEKASVSKWARSDLP
jgi:hypothetical protein